MYLAECFAFVGDVGGDVHEGANVGIAGGCVGDRDAAVGVADDDHITIDLVECSAHGSGVERRAAQWIDGGDDFEAFVAEQ